LVAISPQTREKNAEIKDRHDLEFPVLSDRGNAWAKRLSLTFELPEDLRKVYRSFDIDLPEANGDDSWELPIPARIVVDRDGVIRDSDADPDYTSRPEPEKTLQVLRRLHDGNSGGD